MSNPLMIENPVLPGFHPDPSICRVGNDYYIATSTFQWFPGVRLHHSRDLVNWRRVGYALTRTSQLDMLGNEDCGGIWAPCLSWCDGLFWLIYTDTKNWTAPGHDSHNYVVTAPSIEGPWSEPTFLSSRGFDASLFHDDDGRSWFLIAEWNHRQVKTLTERFTGILLQEFDRETRSLKGPVKKIFTGTELGLVEGPHLYRRNGWYYLLTAEGGTAYSHACTFARSRDIDGPYEVTPGNPILTAWDKPQSPLQRCGHGSFVETPDGTWILAHLAGRPLLPERRCILGRETCLQRYEWGDDDWLYPASETNGPELQLPAPDLPPHPFDEHAKKKTFFDHFNSQSLSSEWNTLRVPFSNAIGSLTARPGFLRLFAGESLFSKHRQSLVATRILDLQLVARTVIDFSPTSFQQEAGLIFYYDTTNYHYLRISFDGTRRVLGILTCEANNYIEYPECEIAISEGDVELIGEMDHHALRFFAVLQGGEKKSIGPVLDATVIADEYKNETKFTGGMVGLCAQDFTGRRIPADFDFFELKFGQ